MIREKISNLSDIRLILVITIVLLSMFMRLFLVDAQETDYKEKWQEAEILNPNVDYLFNTFSFKGEIDWYKFDAEQGVTYQIFTRSLKGYNSPDILIYLFSDPEGSYIARSKIIQGDGSTFIEWTSPSSASYFVSVKALDYDVYGDMEAYKIQITSIDLQNEHTIIPDVPDYSQSEYGNLGDCKAIASACLLGYWDAHKYSLLVDSDPDRPEDVKRLVRGLNEAMLLSSDMSPQKLFTDENVREGIEMYCNLPQFGNNYNFSVEYYPRPDFSKIIDEIEENRPVMYGVARHPLWGNHWMVTVGYLETEITDWAINHDNWDLTPKDIYVDWDEATDCIITVRPGIKKILITSHPDIYSAYQYTLHPMVFPWFKTLPTIGYDTISTFNVIDNMLSPSWSSGLNIGYPKYSSQFYSAGTSDVRFFGNPELSNDRRSMAVEGGLSPFSSYAYNDSIVYDNTLGYNYTTGSSNIISNQNPGSYMRAYLNDFSYMNVAIPGAMTPLDNLLLSPFQMFFPVLGLVPYNIFSPFSPLALNPFLFGAPF